MSRIKKGVQGRKGEPSDCHVGLTPVMERKMEGQIGRVSYFRTAPRKIQASWWLVLKPELPVEGVPRSSLCHLLEAATRSIRMDPQGQQLRL